MKRDIQKIQLTVGELRQILHGMGLEAYSPHKSDIEGFMQGYAKVCEVRANNAGGDIWSRDGKEAFVRVIAAGRLSNDQNHACWFMYMYGTRSAGWDHFKRIHSRKYLPTEQTANPVDPSVPVIDEGNAEALALAAGERVMKELDGMLIERADLLAKRAARP